MSKSTKLPRRRAKTFGDGFVMGLAAPSMLISGLLTECRSQAHKSTERDAWNDVGRIIRDSARNSGAGSASRDKRRA